MTKRPDAICPTCGAAAELVNGQYEAHTKSPFITGRSGVKWKLVIPSGSVHGIYDSREDAERALRELTKDIPPRTAMAGAFMIVEAKPEVHVFGKGPAFGATSYWWSCSCGSLGGGWPNHDLAQREANVHLEKHVADSGDDPASTVA